MCVPPWDTLFADLVGDVVRPDRITTPEQLEDELRPFYPQVRVRPRELSGEPPGV